LEAIDSFREKTVELGFPGLLLHAILWRNIASTLSDVHGDPIAT